MLYEARRSVSIGNLHSCTDRGPVVEPRGGTQRHRYAAVRTILPTVNGIVVPDISTRTIDAMPPGVVQEEASGQELQRVVNIGWWVPVHRAIGKRRIERRRTELGKDVEGTRRRFQSWATGHHCLAEDLLAVLVSIEPLLREVHDNNLALTGGGRIRGNWTRGSGHQFPIDIERRASKAGDAVPGSVPAIYGLSRGRGVDRHGSTRGVDHGDRSAGIRARAHIYPIGRLAGPCSGCSSGNGPGRRVQAEGKDDCQQRGE